MPQQPGSSFADDLAALRSSQRPSAGETDFASELDRLRREQAEAPDPRSTFARVVDAARTPLLPQIAAGARWLADQISDPNAARVGNPVAQAVLPTFLQGQVSPDQARGFLAGGVEGVGDVATGFTSPLDILLTVGGLKSVRDAGRGIGTVARAVNAIGSAALAARGAERLKESGSAPGVGMGLMELAGGLGGLHGATVRPPEPPPVRIRGVLGAGPVRVTPEGVAVPPGQTIPMQQAPDGSFVRAVPGEYAQHEIRGALPPGPDFVAGPGGVARLADAERFAADLASLRSGVSADTAVAVPAPVRGKSAAPQSSVRAAIADYTPEGPVYSSDPHAASVVGVPIDDLERRELRRMLAEMENTEFTRHTFNYDVQGQGGAPEIVPGGGGAPVYQDIVDVHGGSGPGRATIEAAIRKVLDGDRTAYGVAIREVARQRMSGRLGAILPPDAGDLPQSGAMTEGDFNEFDAFVNRLSGEHASDREWFGETGREPGAEGRANVGALLHLGGGVLGGATGALTGNTPEERIKRGLAGAVVGAILPAAMTTAGPRLSATLGEQLAAKGITPASLDARLSGLTPTETVRPIFRDPIEAAYARILQQGGRSIVGGERGAVDTGTALRLGGTVAGGVAGAASGDTPEDRVRRGFLGAAGGYLAGAGGARVLGRVLPEVQGAVTGARPLARVVSVDGIPVTARRAPAPENAMSDPLAGVDTFLGKFPEEVRAGIRGILEDNVGFEAQRRGAIPQDQAQRLAEAVAVDVSKRVKPGTALNVEGIRAHVDALAGAQQKVNDLSQRVARGAATDADIVALEQAKAEAATVAASIMGARSEAGRSLAQFKILARVIQTGDPRLIRQTADGLRGDAAQLAEQFAQLPDDPVVRYRWLQSREASTRWEKVRSYYYANILSGIKTHERNTLGNLANAVSNVVVHPLAAGADVVRSAVTGQPRTVLFSELPSQVAGTLAGIPKGISEALYSLRNGVNRSALTQSLSAAEAGKLDVRRVEFGGGGANPFNWPGRALDSADQFFRAIARESELYALAHNQARREGLAGQRLVDRMAALTSGVDAVSQELQTKADTFARRAVFQETPGPIARSIQAFSKSHPLFSFVVPFVKTPANILRQGLEFSPAGFGMSAARAGGREGAQALGRATAGTLALGYLAYLASTGRLSGSGPSDPIERAQLLESGWRPNSVKIGNQWVNYSLFQPLSVPAAVMANGFEQWRDRGAKPDEAPDVASRIGAVVLKSGQSFLDNSFLSGLAELIDSVENFDLRSAGRVAGRVAHSLTPFAGAQRTVTQAVDPMVRQPGNMTETIKASVPGLSSSVPARLDRFGNAVQREGGPLRRAADPFNVSTESDDPVLRELGRLGVRMGMPGGTLNLPGSPALSREDARGLQVAKGQTVYTVLARVMAMPQYQALPDDQKADALKGVISKSRAAAGQAYKQALIDRLAHGRTTGR